MFDRLLKLLLDEGSGDPRRQPTPKRAPATRRRIGRGRRRRGERGIALVMVLAMVVFLTAFIVEFSYQSRVQFLQGANYRDSVQAVYLAKSGVQIYTLFMVFCQQIASNPLVQQYAGQFGLDLGDKLWQQLPFIDTAFLRAALGGVMIDADEFNLGSLESGDLQFEFDEATEERIDAAIERDSTALTRSFLGFEGDFRAEINDEDGKVNINALADFSGQDMRLSPSALAMYGMMADEAHDDMFDLRNEFDRWELIANIKDFIDTDTTQSSMMGGYEDSLYSDAEVWGREFKPKNIKFDSLDEVQLVAGVSDEIYLTFGPHWTIYGNNKVNITTCNPAVLYGLIRAFAEYSVNDMLIQECVGEIQVMRMLNMLTTESFMATIDAKGILLTDRSALQGLIKTNSRHFTISSTGYVGDVEKTVEVVMYFPGARYQVLAWKEL